MADERITPEMLHEIIRLSELPNHIVCVNGKPIKGLCFEEGMDHEQFMNGTPIMAFSFSFDPDYGVCYIASQFPLAKSWSVRSFEDVPFRA